MFEIFKYTHKIEFILWAWLPKIIISRKRITEESTSSEYECGARLPPTDVPKFNGNLEKWTSFKKQFGSLIEDKRVRFNDSLKKRYLFQALSDEALAIVENTRDARFRGFLCYEVPTRRCEDFHCGHKIQVSRQHSFPKV